MFARLAEDDGGYESESKRPPAMAFSLTEKDSTTPHEDQTMTELKNKVSKHEYTVDSALVAEEILRKLRMIRWARHELVNGSGRTPHQKLRGL